MDQIRDIHHEDFFVCKTPKEKILFLLRYAILAPSTHNSQPWLFKIKKNICEVYYDPKKLLPNTDKITRDLHISMGCCIENIIQSARIYHVSTTCELFSNMKSNKIAEIYFTFKAIKKINNQEDLAMLEAMIQRVNVRGKYHTKKISSKIIDEIVSSVRKNKSIFYIPVTNHHLIQKIVGLTAQGLRDAYKSSHFREEMSHWFIPNKTNRKDGIPGYAINFPDVVSHVFPIIVRYFDIGPIVGFLNKKSMTTTPLISVISTKSESREEWIEVGRAAQRIMLLLKTHDITSAVYVAAVEINKNQTVLQTILRTDKIPQFVFCSGYSPLAKKYFTPRHMVTTKLLEN